MMATVAPLTALAPEPTRSRGRPSTMFVWLSALCLLIAVIGFIPTYWAQIAQSTFRGTPLIHLHAIVFTAWPLLLVSQSVLIARGGLRHHRAWGLAGIVLATTMFLVGLATAVVGMEHRIAQGYGDLGRHFLVVPFAAIGGFYGFFIAAIANINRSEWHKRFIIVATASVLQAAMARFFFYAAHGMAAGQRPDSFPPAPVAASLLPIFTLDLIIVVGAIIDWRRGGKVHPAWLWGLGILVPVQLLRAPLSQTDAWMAFADWLTRFT